MKNFANSSGFNLLECKKTDMNYAPPCYDSAGEKISLGDYVVGCSGVPKKEGREGYVIEIVSYEYGSFIKIATPGGRIVAISDYASNYIKKEME